MRQAVKGTTVGDRLLLAGMAAASFVIFFFSRDALSRSSEVLIEVDGRPAYTFPLGVDRTIDIVNGRGHALLEIRGKRVRVRDADCPNRICVKEGWVERGVIVCLPHKIVIFVGGRDTAPGAVDAISG